VATHALEFKSTQNIPLVSPNIIESVRSRVNLESRNGMCRREKELFNCINADNTFEKALSAKPIRGPSWRRNPSTLCLSDPMTKDNGRG
jgi:hypothetical protein